jgi:hypothetical protein
VDVSVEPDVTTGGVGLDEDEEELVVTPSLPPPPPQPIRVAPTRASKLLVMSLSFMSFPLYLLT